MTPLKIFKLYGQINELSFIVITNVISSLVR